MSPGIRAETGKACLQTHTVVLVHLRMPACTCMVNKQGDSFIFFLIGPQTQDSVLFLEKKIIQAAWFCAIDFFIGMPDEVNRSKVSNRCDTIPTAYGPQAVL